MLALTALGLALALQNPNPPVHTSTSVAGGETTPANPAIPVTDSGAVATRAQAAPVIDGRGDDAVWRDAPPITHFVDWQPTEGKEPRFRTMAKVAYDDANLYVFVRAFDPHPDSIIAVLERRDTYSASDKIWVFVDSYHDRRTGFEFGVNPAGVKMDGAIYDDGNEDFAWDAVWDVATHTDSLGWTAEFRFPLSQLRYGKEAVHTFGLTIDRDVYRFNERSSWPVFSQSRPGFVSQFGTLTGLTGLQTPRRLEAMPYVVTKNAQTIVNNQFTHPSSASIGGDLKYRIASNLSLDATINPDFGQVESDPAVLNLSAYESFFDERRPFFVAGRGLFRFDVNCSEVNCSSEGLYYSRRIGRTPQLAGTYGDTVPESPTTILGAAKLLGRFPGGMTVGVLDAVTQDATSGDTTFEPRTNYAAIRAKQDFNKGNSYVGAMITAVNRGNDVWSSPYLADNAYAIGLDFSHRIIHNDYEVAGSLDQSRVDGSRAAINGIQTDAVHYYQRPDAALPYDSTATTLGGDAEELKFSKYGGQHWKFSSAYQRRSPGFEVNDMGYLRRADQQSWSTWTGWFDRKERRFYQRFQWNHNWWQYWTTDGLPLEAAYNTNLHITLRNYWSVHTGGTIGQLGTTYDDRAARGGPAVRNDPYVSPWIFLMGDDRRAIVPMFNVQYTRNSGGRSVQWYYGPQIDFKMRGRFSGSLSLSRSTNVSDNQFYGVVTDDSSVSRYTFAHLDQTTNSATVRVNYTFTPNVSLQVYTQPFVSKGTFSNVRRLSDTPRADDYDARYAPLDAASVTSDPGGFNFKEFQSNVVFRWEYKPGSTLFAVWNEGRQGSLPFAGTRDFSGDVRDLMALHPSNTFLVKVSYWLNR